MEFSGAHRRWNQRPGGDAGGSGERLFDGAVLLPRAPAARTRSLVLPANVQVPQVLLLQELRVHALPLLVRLLLRILRPGQSLTPLENLYSRNGSEQTQKKTSFA